MMYTAVFVTQWWLFICFRCWDARYICACLLCCCLWLTNPHI